MRVEQPYANSTPTIPDDFYQYMENHLLAMNSSIKSPTELYQLSPAGVMLYAASKYGASPDYICTKGSNDEVTQMARLVVIDMLSKLFDWKDDRLGNFVGRNGMFAFRSRREIEAMKLNGAWPE